MTADFVDWADSQSKRLSLAGFEANASGNFNSALQYAALSNYHQACMMYHVAALG